MNHHNSILRYVRLTDPKDIQDYLFRQEQPLPNAPRINIQSKNNQIISVYVQKLTNNFFETDWKAISEQSLFQYLQTAIIANMSLKKKYGCFGITQNHIKVGLSNSLRVWMNEDPVLNYRQFPLPFQKTSQAIMVKGILKLFKPLLPQLQKLGLPQTLLSFLTNVRTIKNPNVNYSKHIQDQPSSFTQSRKAIKSFYQIPKQKIISNKLMQLNSSLQGSPNKNYTTNVKNFNSPNNMSMNQNKKDSTFESPSSSFTKKNNTIANELMKRLINFTYSSPFSMKTSMMHCQRESQHFIEPTLQRSAHPIGESLRHPQSQSIIAEQYKQDLEEKQKLFGPSKFPHSTQSTFVTLKQTKSFADMHFEQFQTDAIEEQSNEYKQKSSKQSKGSQIHEKISKSGSQREIRSKKSGQNEVIKKSMIGGEIQDDFQNLFFMDKQEQSKNQQQFFKREMEFEDILFS